ncbi:hypothetical protein [Serratia marcescens]|uniref:hypothetical protein n=1 Tax=Serratia marcescens TaxID=615 RepID=UPI0029069007|nr:hypothetical protein [Serratia marcescens]
MTNLSELSKPVAWTDERGNLCTTRNKERGLESRYHQDYEKYTTPFYSQEYVSALQHESAVNWEAAASLNVENQELKKRIAELERANQSQDDHINQQQDRIDSLEKKNGDLGRSLGAAEKRLATPVRLPEPCVYEVNGTRFYDRLSEAEVIASLREQGFTVEGDE